MSPVATILGAEHHRPGAPPGRLRSAGRPVYSAEVRVADAEDRELPRGEVGEIIVRGPIVMMGYRANPDSRRKRCATGGCTPAIADI